MQAARPHSTWHHRPWHGRWTPRRDRPPRARFKPASTELLRGRAQPVVDLRRGSLDWPEFWAVIWRALRRAGFTRSTLRVYRQVLRSLRRDLEQRHGTGSARSRPGAMTRAAAHDFISELSNQHASWSWMSVNVSVLRTAFDKLGGLGTTTELSTAKRPVHLGEVVTEKEVRRMLAAAPTVRDRLLIGLLYGCGLKVGEACGLRWADVDVARRTLTVRYAADTRQRQVELPEVLLPVLKAGRERCPACAHIFAGAKGGQTHVSTRTAQRIVRRAAMEAEVEKPVCCMTMRHSYAVSLRRQGVDVRSIQERLGHRRLETAMRYDRYTPPPGVISPVDRLRVAGSLATVPPRLFASDLRFPRLDLLPMPFAGIADGADEFQVQLTARLGGRFLALRGAVSMTG